MTLTSELRNQTVVSPRAFDPDTPLPDPEFNLSVAITSPAPGANVSGQTTVTITGTAEVVGAAIDRVDVSVGNGGTVKRATLTGPATSHVTWTASNVAVGGAQGDTLTVTATAFIDGEFGESVTRDLVADHSPPVVTLTSPRTMVATLNNGQATFTIHGDVSDALSAVDRVEFRVGSGAFQPATRTGGSWTTGNAIVLTAVSTHEVQIRARDVHGNTSVPDNVTVRAVPNFVPHDASNVFGPADYLDDLLTYASARIKVNATTTQPAATFASTLEGIFGQRFAALISLSNQDVAGEVVPQVRIAVEVLRRYLDAAGQKPDAATQTAYLTAAYDALLAGLGTTRLELARSRTDADARTSLAARMAIEPGRLSELPIVVSELTEGRLETLSGLVSTTRDVLAARPPSSNELVRFRLESLAVRWVAEDDGQRIFATVPVPVVDPDVLTADDVVPGTAAHGLFTQRADRLADLTATIHSNIADDGLDATIDALVAPVEQLVKLRQAQQAGVDVRADLDGLRLRSPALRRLLQVRDLAAAGTALEPDVADAEAVVAGVQKVRLADVGGEHWRAQERAAGVTHLDPNQFVLREGAAPTLDPLRTPPAARRRWRQTLRARIAEADAAVSTVATAVDGAEAAALPTLRDALAARARTLAPNANRPSVDGLLVDLSTSGGVRTTRLREAIATVQTCLLAVRHDGFGRFAQTTTSGSPVLHPADSWAIDAGKVTAFDTELVWWGSHETWKSAAQVLAFPESHLLPTMRAGTATPTAAFANLVAALRDAPALTPEQARSAVTAYVAALKAASVNPPLPAGYQATELLTDGDLVLRKQQCATAFGSTTSPFGAAVHIQEAFFFVPLLCAQHLARAGEFLVAIDWLKTVYAYHLPPGPQREIYRGLVLEQATTSQFPRPADNAVSLPALNPMDVAATHNRALTRCVLFSLVRAFTGQADAEFARDRAESLARARLLYETAAALLPELTPSGTGADIVNPYLVDPAFVALGDRVSANLAKLRAGRNIAGLERSGQAAGPSALAPRQPTPFRFSVLISRAKELVQYASQLEAALLAALEKKDNEEYTLLRAQQDVALAAANVDLQNLRVTEAGHNVDLAALQRAHAELQADHFEDELEFDDADRLEIAGIIATAAGQFLGGLVPGQDGIPVIGAVAGAFNAAGTIASGFSAREQRRRDLEFQLAVARQDEAIGTQQVELANDQFDITLQERRIASLQAINALQTVEFLARKFTSAELYEFMSEVLVDVYRSLLQHATATARLAEAQLAFERQTPLLGVIRGDYWEVTADGRGLSSTPDRRGLTGSARLLADIVDLDQRAFLSDRRRLQLTKTISLARLAPAAFQRFRQTGVIVFGTPEELFDRDFPGHFLRLIKRVRVSTVALVPPDEGIRAELSCSGVSRTVAADGATFRTVAVRRDPETVALTATRDATGLFELVPDARPDLLLPFEGGGVDALWRLEMPTASNRFDFGSIADVLVTIEYEALSSAAYRPQVLSRLDRHYTADRPFSIRNDYPDKWFELHNPATSPDPLTVTLPVSRADFPANIDEFRTEHLVAYFAATDGDGIEIADVTLTFTPTDGGAPITAATSTNDGVITTRRSSNSTWIPLTGRTPFGTWKLTLPDTPALRQQLDHDTFDDILLIISHSARTVAFPD
jgi:hypothetical protein